ncbi:MAG TPA: selenide, water dikinase SelD, partial [Syntrophobacteraceae bacterium]|nr:selenide, water dikinase SelD [Syntrophobacteraceae bacterium]
MGPGDLADILNQLPAEVDPRLMVGRETSDDAGVYRLTDDIALIQTVDFFTPVVNDPYEFGRIAAANALSDVYAMGGRPLTAMNIVCFPLRQLDKSILKEILRGGHEKIREAGAALVGGHSVDDLELKYGLSVTGIVHPDRVLTNAEAQPGDALILTKPIGTGILATAIKGALLPDAAIRHATAVMATLNKAAAETMASYPVHACTDITGFGLLGHALEVAVASRVTIEISVDQVPLLPEVHELASMGLIPAGTYSNRNFCSTHVKLDNNVDPVRLDLLADAQTSGGLLIFLSQATAPSLLADLHHHGVADAAIIGHVVHGNSAQITV